MINLYPCSEVWLVWAQRKATVSQITTFYICGELKSMSECTTHRTLNLRLQWITKTGQSTVKALSRGKKRAVWWAKKKKEVGHFCCCTLKLAWVVLFGGANRSELVIYIDGWILYFVKLLKTTLHNMKSSIFIVYKWLCPRSKNFNTFPENLFTRKSLIMSWQLLSQWVKSFFF